MPVKRSHLATISLVALAVACPEQTAARLPTLTGDNAATWFFHQPFGPVSLTAHGPDLWAQAVSSRYQITVHRRGAEQVG